MAVTLEGRASATSTPVEVLILTNFDRMKDIGYDSASVDDLKTKLQDLADNNPNGRGVLVDLDTVASINTAYTNWDGNEGDIANTNDLVQVIDNYIEDLKQNRYPKLKYVILVGSHEVLPMKARADDYTFGGGTSERAWSNKLPQKSGYLYDIYHAGINGHYLTDTIYGDLSYKDNSADHELTPELAVGRLVETPDQIIGVIDAYMAHGGMVSKNNLVSIGADSLVTDSARLAADYMDATGISADRALISDTGFSSSLVPPKLNNKDIIYIGTHANYNCMGTLKGRFMAGLDPTEGDTSELSGIDNAVISTTGCHGGVNFGNKQYHAPDTGTTYSEFPEEFAKKGVVSYLGNTGYGVGGTKSVGFNEKIATDFIKYFLHDRTTGEAFTKAANEYSKKSNFGDVDRRALAIFTLYGIPTAKAPLIASSSTRVNSAVKIGKGMTINSISMLSSSKQWIIEIDEYQIDPTTGIVDIPGAKQEVNFDEPIMPVLFKEKTLPLGSSISVSWNQGSSVSTIIKHDLSIAGIYNSEAVLPGNFTSNYFYPTTPFFDYEVYTLGGGSNVVGVGINPVQYNSQTGETKIWTKMVFDIEYTIPDTNISVVDLSTDKYLYSPDETVMLNISILNDEATRSVDLSMTLRDADTSEELATVNIGSMSLTGGTTSSETYSMGLSNIPRILGKTIEGELLVMDQDSDNIFASDSVKFEVKGIFDTGKPANPYPSVIGRHEGTIKTSDDINVSRLYTYPCAGTSGHTESIELSENGETIATGTWDGYQSDWHNVSIHNVSGAPYVMLYKGHKYNYTIVTGSYPQIIHEHSKEVTGGTITCTLFTDANGKTYTDWIPAIRLE